MSDNEKTMARKERFLRFFRFLENNLDFDFDVEVFEDKIRLQKLVYISERFGFSHGYYYSKYIRGPYSSELADDYYSIEESEIPEDYSPILEGFEHEDFTEFVRGKDARELELIATVISVWKNYRSKFRGEELGNRVMNTSADIKSRAEESRIESITLDLSEKGIIDLDLESQN